MDLLFKTEKGVELYKEVQQHNIDVFIISLNIPVSAHGYLYTFYDKNKNTDSQHERRFATINYFLNYSGFEQLSKK